MKIYPDTELLKGSLHSNLKTAFVLMMSLLFLNASEAQQFSYSTLISPSDTLQIMRRPPALDFSKYKGRGVISTLPEQDEGNFTHWRMDLRSCDVSSIDLSGKIDDLMIADFDSKTIWPESLPDSFNPDEIMELGKDPGLDVRKLHDSGITGKNIGIAIIDQALLVDHIEYKDQLRSYEEIHWKTNSSAQVHGSLLASRAVGKNVGVAPEADLYFIACAMGDYDENGQFEYNLEYLTRSIERIIQINQTLPAQRKIQVISISLELRSALKNYDLARKAIQRAEADHITTLHVGSHNFLGMGRRPLSDPNLLSSYGAGLFWKDRAQIDSTKLLVPIDARTIANFTGESDYAFHRSGGMSGAVPYLAGLYALACQCDENITFGEFWELLDKTSVPIKENGRVVGKAVIPMSIAKLKHE